MAKSKYNPETVDRICNAIATEGRDESGWLAGNIHRDTFYDWINRYSEFSDRVSKARADFRKNANEHLKGKATERLLEAITEGHKSQYQKQRTSRKDHFNAAGELEWYEITTEEFTGEAVSSTPQWAIDRVLAPPVHSLADLQKVADRYGLELVVKNAELFDAALRENLEHWQQPPDEREILTASSTCSD